MSSTLVTEIKQCVQRLKKINHGLPLHQTNANGVYTYICISYDSLVTLRFKKNCQSRPRTKARISLIKFYFDICYEKFQKHFAVKTADHSYDNVYQIA
jgi:hypothetical protein